MEHSGGHERIPRRRLILVGRELLKKNQKKREGLVRTRLRSNIYLLKSRTEKKKILGV